MTSPQPLRDDLAALVAEPPGNPDRLAAVRRRARRMRRNRALGAGLAVIAVVVAVVAATGVGPVHRGEPVAPAPTPAPGQPDPTALPTGILLEDPHGNVLRLPDLHAGRTVAIRGPHLPPGRQLSAVVGPHVVTLDRTDDIVVIDVRDPSHFTVMLPNVSRDPSHPKWRIPGLGPRLLVGLFATKGGSSLWLWTVPVSTSLRTPPSGGEATPVDLSGTPSGRSVVVPRGAVPVAVGRTGIYATGPSPAGAHSMPLLRIGFDGAVSTVAGDAAVTPTMQYYGVLVWDCSHSGSGSTVTGACPINVLDADTGRTARFSDRAGPGTLAIGPVEMSPDGRYLAANVLGLSLPAQGFHDAIGVLDLRTGRATVVSRSLFVDPTGTAQLTYTWSGDRLLWTRPAGGGGTVVGAYLPATGKATTTTAAPAGLAPLAAAG